MRSIAGVLREFPLERAHLHPLCINDEAAQNELVTRSASHHGRSLREDCVLSSQRKLDTLLPESELEIRRQKREALRATHFRGRARRYAESVAGTESGCDFNFLRDGG
jgi:hypothetical protein